MPSAWINIVSCAYWFTNSTSLQDRTKRQHNSALIIEIYSNILTSFSLYYNLMTLYRDHWRWYITAVGGGFYFRSWDPVSQLPQIELKRSPLPVLDGSRWIHIHCEPWFSYFRESGVHFFRDLQELGLQEKSLLIFQLENIYFIEKLSTISRDCSNSPT